MKIKLPATTANLGPGFDCLGAALNLYNEFEIVLVENGKQKLKVSAEGIDKELIPLDETNHVYVGIKHVFNKIKIKLPSIEIYIKNNIPLQRGLGSSATAYLAGVVAGNVLCGEPFSEYELLNFAIELEGHPDNVVACMYGGLCISNLVDGKIKFIKLPLPKDLTVLTIIPQEKISTKKAREVLPKNIKFKDAVSNLCNTAMLIGAIVSKRYEFLRFATQDFLHQPYRKKLMPWMEKVFEVCLKNGALCSMLSGSGSTIVAFYKKSDINEEVIDVVKTKLSKIFACDCKVLQFNNEGLKIKI